MLCSLTTQHVYSLYVVYCTASLLQKCTKSNGKLLVSLLDNIIILVWLLVIHMYC